MHIRKILVAALVALICLLPVSSVLAADYGSGAYGQCEYGHGCNQHTIITTPSGLEIAVNLVDGQTISSDGYDIVVTPLNGSGTSFQSVDIYIDGQLVATVQPDETGTATWHWDPAQYPGTVIKVVATDQDGKTVSKQFTVVVKNKSSPGNGHSSGGGGNKHSDSSSSNPIFKLASAFVKSAKTILRSLPKPVVFAFPYLLFIVLLIEIGLLVLQTKRELSELRTLRRLVAQQKEVSDLKQGFLQLVSHYLRTPLTILRSGAEGLPSEGVAPAIVNGIQQTAKNLSQTIEDIIGSIDSGGSVVTSPAATIGKVQTRQKIVVWLPVIFVGLFAALFVYFANSVTKYDAGVVSIIIQVLIYTALASVVYQVWRRLHLHRRDRQNTKSVLTEVATIQTSRDQVIHQAASSLDGYVGSLEASAKQIPPTAINAKFVTKGLSQLKTVQHEFLIASRLQGARSEAPYEPVALSTLFADAADAVAEKVQKKNIKLQLVNDAQLSTQSSSLAALVLQTLLDNAVAYSAEGGAVEVSAQTDVGVVHVVVTDHGQGVPAAKLNMLFQPFSKAEGAEVFTHEGMGFSLYLDKLIMTYLGGEIQIQSEESQGTQVALSFASAIRQG